MSDKKKKSLAPADFVEVAGGQTWKEYEWNQWYQGEMKKVHAGQGNPDFVKQYVTPFTGKGKNMNG